MDNYITREEHEEFRRRIEGDNKRQDARISELEQESKEIHELNISLNKMAVNMESMFQEQKKQGKRLEALEAEPAETQKQIKNSVITALCGGVVGAIVTAFLALL